MRIPILSSLELRSSVTEGFPVAPRSVRILGVGGIRDAGGRGVEQLTDVVCKAGAGRQTWSGPQEQGPGRRALPVSQEWAEWRLV